MPYKYSKDIIEAKKRIINEVRRYAVQKRLLTKLSSIYFEEEEALQNKSTDELVCIYENTIEVLHTYSEQVKNIGNYIKLIRNSIIYKIRYKI